MWQDHVVAHNVDETERSKDVLLSESVTFDELLLSKSVLSGLKKSGFNIPSPIQLKAIPLGRCGLDLVVQAKSGTGKTCVFSVIALDAVNALSSSLQVVVLAPTREIALQIHGVISCIGQDIEGLSVQVFIGGTLVSEDRLKAKKCHIAIGSPGRLKQLIELGVLETRNVRIFVLDEADKLVEEGSFQKQINWIYSSLPINKQMLALSATYPEELAEFLSRYMREPTYVRLDASQPSLLGLRQYYRVIPECSLPHILFEEKAKEVIQLFSNVFFQQALVFSNYHSRAESICEALCSSGWPSTFISGNMEQSRRTEAINKLKQFKCRVLISTDLTSRGIDAQNVDLVINMDLPHDWETYLHRIGRAGRFGSRGIAVSLVSAGEEEKKLQLIAARCNATILPLLDVNELRKHAKSNATTKKIEISDETIQYKTVANAIAEPALPRDQSKDSTSPIKNDTSCDVEVSELRDQSDTSQNETSNVLNVSSRTVEWDKFDERGFFAKFINSPDTPKIPSVKELLSKTDHLKKNKHYLTMSYKDLKTDFEHFVRTGEFTEPPKTESALNVDELESRMADLTTKNNENAPPSGERVSTNVVDVIKLSKNPLFVNSKNLPAKESMNSSVTDSNLPAVSKALFLKSKTNQTSDSKGSSVMDLKCSSAGDSNPIKSKNNQTFEDLKAVTKYTSTKTSISESKVNTLKNQKQSKPTLTAKEKGWMKSVRQRHPDCAAAGLESLKHWAEVEKVNSKYPQAPPSNAKNHRPVFARNLSNTGLKRAPHLDSELCDEDLESETDSSEYTSDSDTSESDAYLSTDYSEESDTSSSNTSASYSLHPTSGPVQSPFYPFNTRCPIPPPPVMLQFGPTGHCFNPLFCLHPASQDITEALISHQVYHQALHHARHEVSRYFEN